MRFDRPASFGVLWRPPARRPRCDGRRDSCFAVPAEVAVTLEERAATFGLGESFGWFVIGALLLIVGVFGVVTIVIALREARERKGLEALAADTARGKSHVNAEEKENAPCAKQ